MRHLLSTVRLSLTPFHYERLRMIDEADYSGVRRKVREELEKQGVEVTEEYLDEGLLALKQYYAVALLDPCNEHAVSDNIDPFWHAHILHTREYVAFCERVYGQFIHHDPLNHADDEQVAQVARLYEHTSQVYRRMFSYINDEFYPTDVPEYRLVCKHYEVNAEIVRANALLPKVEMAHHATA